MSHDKDVEFMLEAYQYAQDFSTDPSTQNGAVLVAFTDESPDGCIVSRGANHFPFGVRELPERWERPIKYSFVEHAERNAIFDAARKGEGTAHTVMYCPWVACDNCARAIIQAGITEVVGHRPDPASMSHIDKPNGSWDQSIAIGMQMLEEAGVSVRYLEGKLDPSNRLKVRRNGSVYNP